MTSFTSEDELRHHALMEWRAAAPGWKKYGKDMLRLDGSSIRAAHRVGWY